MGACSALRSRGLTGVSADQFAVSYCAFRKLAVGVLCERQQNLLRLGTPSCGAAWGHGAQLANDTIYPLATLPYIKLGAPRPNPRIERSAPHAAPCHGGACRPTNIAVSAPLTARRSRSCVERGR